MFARAALFAALLILAACAGDDGPSPVGIVEQQGAAPPEGTVIGDGSVTVAMLLPRTAGGSASNLAQSFQNAAELALGETPEDQVRIMIFDTSGETDNARLAAEAAITQGAQLILGPVFAPAVSGAADAARAANVPMIAFSTDANVSGRGTYLLSFLPKQDATRVIAFAARERNLSAFSALVPNDGYGLVMEAAFREAVAGNGGRVIAVERYEPGNIASAAEALANRNPAQAIFIPNGGDDPVTAARILRQRGVNAQLLGSGQWDNSAITQAPELAGAWYPGPANTGYQGFADRFQSRYGAQPPRTASLVYDAVLLANGLVAARGPAAFAPQSLTAADGFLGVDGIFRLTPAGLSERGLSIYEVGGTGASVISAAPTTFRPT